MTKATPLRACRPFYRSNTHTHSHTHNWLPKPKIFRSIFSEYSELSRPMTKATPLRACCPFDHLNKHTHTHTHTHTTGYQSLTFSEASFLNIPHYPGWRPKPLFSGLAVPFTARNASCGTYSDNPQHTFHSIAPCIHQQPVATPPR